MESCADDDARRKKFRLGDPSSFERVSRRDMSRRAIKFTDDEPSDMTYSRRAALYLSRTYGWYNPQLLERDTSAGVEVVSSFGFCDADRDAGGGSIYIEMDDVSADGSFNRSMLRSPVRRERPSLEKAWAYFEHVTLPRYLDHAAARREDENDASDTTRSIGWDMLGGNDSSNKISSRRSEDLVGKSARAEKRNHLLSRWASQVRQNQGGAPKTNKVERDMVLDLAEPGEDTYPTKLYSPLWTPMDQMGDFGLGVGLYFTALRSLTILAFIAGVINIPNMIYYASDQYSSGQDGIGFSLKGSAVCTDQQFVPCPTCSVEDFADAPHRIATATSYYGDGDLFFAVKNNCDGAKMPLALVNFSTLLFIIYGMVKINRHLKDQEVKFDEDEQTAQDYSLVVKNPPHDATNPEEWKAFFEKDGRFGPGIHVTCITIAKDNYKLVRALVRRREILQQLKWKLPPGSPLDEASLCVIANELMGYRITFGKLKSYVIPDVPALLHQLIKVNNKVKRLAGAEGEFPATRIFVTFETEAAQRRILNYLSVGSNLVRKNAVVQVENNDHLFRTSVALNVKEADEPSTIRWHDLTCSYYMRVAKMMLTACAWLCAMILVAFLVKVVRHRSSEFAAYTIAAANGAFPVYARKLVSFESHPSEGRVQTSIYLKIVAFRYINTAILVYMITPFSMTLGSGSGAMLEGVCQIFLAEIVFSSLVKFVDPVGLLERHFLAPRSGSQEEMNSHMRGEEWHLAERYTNMSKLFFLALWYSSIYPFGFFLCSATLYLSSFADSYSLMRTWRRNSRLGSYISSHSAVMTTLAISASWVAASYAWSGFPYDNLCMSEENGGGGENDDALELEDFIGDWNIQSLDGSKNMAVTVSDGDPAYRFCQQSLYWNGKGFDFPAIPYWQVEGDEWMTDEQEFVTNFFGWTSFFLVIIVCAWILRISFRALLYRSTYEACGDDQGIPFSEVAAISSYIPEVKSNLFSYPLLAVDTEGVDEELYEWKDAEKPYSYYDLTRDARKMLQTRDVKHLFSTVSHWQPVKEALAESQRSEGSTLC